MSSRHIPGYSLARNPKSIVERKQPVECIIVVHTAWEACWSIRSAFKQEPDNCIYVEWIEKNAELPLKQQSVELNSIWQEPLTMVRNRKSKLTLRYH